MPIQSDLDSFRVQALSAAILDSANFTIIATDCDGLIVSCNATVEKQLGYKADELIQKTTPALIHDIDEVIKRANELTIELGRDIQPGFEVFIAKAKIGTADERDWTYVRKDGSRYRVSLSITAMKDDNGEIFGFLGIGQDVTKLRQAERELRDSEARFKAFMSHLPAMAFIKDEEGRLVFVNQRLLENFGKTESELLGRLDHEIWPKEAADALRENDIFVLRNNRPLKCEEEVATPDGKSDTWLSVKFPFDSVDGQKYLAGIAIDISDRKYYERQMVDYQNRLEEAMKQLETLATIDSLTGLTNRGAFDERLADEISRAQRYGLPMSLLMLDVDHFKSFNDNYGHQAGDEALRKVAKLLEDCSRPCDFVSRYGGEEFAIVLVNTPMQGAMIAAERFRKTILDNKWSLRPVTISIGVSELNAVYTDSERLIEAADKALYDAKAKGRNRVSNHCL